MSREDRVYLKPTAPRSIGGVLDDSIRLYRAGIAKVWPLALGAQLLVAVPTLYSSLNARNAVPTGQALLSMYGSPSFWLPYLVCAIATIGFYNAITLQLAAAYRGESASGSQALAAGYRLLPRVLQMYLVLIVVGIAFGIVVAIAMQAPALIRLVLGIAAIPLLIYLLGRVYLAHVALIVDDLGVFKSIQSSWTLTRGHWWRGATIYTVVLLIALVFYLIIMFVVGLITVGFGPASALGIGLTQLVSVLGTSIVLPLVSASLIAIFLDFKLRSEGTDLADRVNALATH
jgi:hypothetical protein